MNPNTISASPFLTASRDFPAVLRLFCIPYAGGGASIYHRWSDGLPAEFQVCPIQLPGRESRFKEAPYHSMATLVDELGRALVSWTEIPFAIFGHSMGAIVGFEVARYLRRVTGKNPVCLFASSRRAPQLGKTGRNISQLSDAEFVREMREHYNGIPEVILQDRELMEMFVPLMKADMSVIESYEYRPEEPLLCKISVFGGVGDRHVSLQALEAWAEQTRGPFRVRQFPGDHFFLKDARAALLQAIGQDLIEVLAGGRSAIPRLGF